MRVKLTQITINILLLGVGTAIVIREMFYPGTVGNADKLMWIFSGLLGATLRDWLND